ncbi:MAG TPA: PilZ domain-containing protein [Terriglobales bacterium]|nr:PilZ domain-containing protein [Terriglobales bacterium]
MATNQAKRERRRAHRVSTDIEVRYGANGELVLAAACDLSEHGIGLMGPRLYPIGTELDLRFRTPREGAGAGTLLFLRGTVRHAVGKRLGLRFAVVPEEARRALCQSVHQLDAP